MTKLKPNAIFSAHDHRIAMATTRQNDSHYFQVDNFTEDSAVIKKQLNDEDCTEVIWPTCSYRMGVEKSGYGFATIGIEFRIFFFLVETIKIFCLIKGMMG